MQRAEQLQPSQGHSLDRLYDIRLEGNRLNTLPEASHHAFLEGQMIGLLNEHAGYVPFSEVEGTMEADGRAHIQGLNLQESWDKTIETYGHWSREHYEVIGYQEGHKALQRPEVSMVVIESPSKEGYADRSFSFVIQKIPNADGSHRLVYTNIMHNADRVTFRAAQERYDSLQQAEGFIGELAEPQTKEEMLVRPLAFASTESAGEVFKMLGLTPEKIKASKEFTNRVHQELGQYVQHFIMLMDKVRSTDPNIDPLGYAEMVKAAQQTRDYLFERAVEVKAAQDEEREEAVADGNVIDITARIQEHYAQHDAPLFYGSLVCDTQASAQFGELLGAYGPHMAGMMSLQLGYSQANSEAWRDVSRWPIGTCRAFGKGGCGAEKVKIGPCAICPDCQSDYDNNRVPKKDRSKKVLAKAA